MEITSIPLKKLINLYMPSYIQLIFSAPPAADIDQGQGHPQGYPVAMPEQPPPYPWILIHV